MDQDNPCVPPSADVIRDAFATPVGCTESGVQHGKLTVPPSCAVCTNSTPCLFDVLADPGETNNVATVNPELVQLLAEKLATYNKPYLLTGAGASLTAANLACYNCTGSNAQGIGKYGDFWGPCCT